MGVFDLRCGVSGLSTTFWPPYADDGPREHRSTCSLFLLEELAGVLVPWTPPLSGTYDSYGAIELCPEDHSPYTAWLDDRLSELARNGALVTSWQKDLDNARDAVAVLHHGTETVYNKVQLAIDGRRVAACIVLDQVADAILAADPAPPRTQADALAMLFPEGGAGRAHFGEPPPEAFQQLVRYGSVVRQCKLTPIRSEDASQQSDDDVRRYARTAWDKGGAIRSYVAACKPDWATRWSASHEKKERREQLLQTGTSANGEKEPWSLRHG